MMVRDLPNRHLNGILAENEWNVDGGKNVIIIKGLCYLHNSTSRIPLKTPFSDGESLLAWHINGILAGNGQKCQNSKNAK